MMQLTHEELAIDAAPNGLQNLMQLEERHKDETLAFLSTRILHTFVMTGWLHDNGLVNPFNRETFYGHLNHNCELAGVSLIGYTTLFVDPNGFRMRCGRRIHQDRVWVMMQDDRLLFKADVITELPEVTYLEGVYVAPEKRGNGFGADCIRQLTNQLLDKSKSVCLL